MKYKILCLLCLICGVVFFLFSCKIRKHYSDTKTLHSNLVADIKDPTKVIVNLTNGHYAKINISDDQKYLIASGYVINDNEDLSIWDLRSFNKLNIQFWNGNNLEQIKDIKIKIIPQTQSYYIAVASKDRVDIWKYENSAVRHFGNFDISCNSITFIQDPNILACAKDEQIWRLNIIINPDLLTERFTKELVFANEEAILQVEYSGIDQSILALSQNSIMLIPFEPKNLQKLNSTNPQKIMWNDYTKWQEGKHFIKNGHCNLSSYSKMFLAENGLIHIIGYPANKIETWKLDIPKVTEHTRKWLWLWTIKEIYPQGGLSCSKESSFNFYTFQNMDTTYTHFLSVKLASHNFNTKEYSFSYPYFSKVQSTLNNSAYTYNKYIQCQNPQLFVNSHKKSYINMIIAYPSCNYFYNIKNIFIGNTAITDMKIYPKKDMIFFSTIDGSIKILFYKKVLHPQLLANVNLQHAQYIDLLSNEEMIVVKSNGEIISFNFITSKEQLLHRESANIKYAFLNEDKTYLTFVTNTNIGIFNLQTKEITYYNEITQSPQTSYEIAKISSDKNHIVAADSYQKVIILNKQSKSIMFQSSYIKDILKTKILDFTFLTNDLFLVLDSKNNLILFNINNSANPLHLYPYDRIKSTYDSKEINFYNDSNTILNSYSKIKAIVNQDLQKAYVLHLNTDMYSLVLNIINLNNPKDYKVEYLKLSKLYTIKDLASWGELIIKNKISVFDINTSYAISLIQDNKLIRWKLASYDLDDLSELYLISQPSQPNTYNPLLLKFTSDNKGAISVMPNGQIYYYFIGD